MWKEPLFLREMSHFVRNFLQKTSKRVTPFFDFFIKSRPQHIKKKTFGDLPPGNIYLFKVNNRNASKICEICSKLTKKTPKGRQ